MSLQNNVSTTQPYGVGRRATNHEICSLVASKSGDVIGPACVSIVCKLAEEVRLEMDANHAIDDRV